LFWLITGEGMQVNEYLVNMGILRLFPKPCQNDYFAFLPTVSNKAADNGASFDVRSSYPKVLYRSIEKLVFGFFFSQFCQLAVSLSIMFAPSLTVLPVKSFPLFTSFASPASCSGVVMVNSVSESLYYLVSALPFHTEA